jgi:spore germination protein YaaH
MQSLIGKYDPQKIVLGIPLYGYEWRTRNADYKSRTYGSGTTASYDRVKKLIEDKGLIPAWDSTASSPWLAYKDNGKIWQIYFEDMKSLAIKFELARQLKLSGIAFWAMGYEGNNKEIWDYLREIL